MDIEQVRAIAETRTSYLHDSRLIKILIASRAGDPVAGRILSLFQSAVDQGNLRAKAFRSGSFGLFDLEPILVVETPGRFAVLYHRVTPDKVAGCIPDLISGISEKVEALGCIGKEKVRGLPDLSESPLFCLQSRIALRNCGWIDPEDIDHYLCRGLGYTGLSSALRMRPREIAEILIPSVLKGRGGPGCSTIEKWKLGENVGGFLICNAVDPDPQSLVSRLILESDPHSVLEGMLIGAYAAGISRAILLVEEKTEAARRLGKALEQMRTYNLLGSNILNSRFCAEITIEEMPALLTSGSRIELFRCLEEKHSLPHILPACPCVSGITGKPVLIANVETMSSLPAVIRNGMKNGAGSKVVTLSGSVLHRYVVEVPHGTTIRSVIDLLGGGVSVGRSMKAVQLGGPAGPFVAPGTLQVPVGCDATNESISNIGSGTIEVLDTDSRIVDTLREILVYLQAQSCGKCVFCREGCLQILNILEDISDRRSRPQDLDLLVMLCEEMKTGCLCDFGRTVPDPVLSSLNCGLWMDTAIPQSEIGRR